MRTVPPQKAKVLAFMVGLTIPVALLCLSACGTWANNGGKENERVGRSEGVSKGNGASMAAGPLHLIHTIPLPSVEGRFDHFALDARRQRLFLAALGNDTLEVIDMRSDKALPPVKGLRNPAGVAFSPELDRVFVAAGGGGTCEILDGDSFAVLHSVRGLPDADNIRYDAATKRIYLGYGEGGLAVIDAVSGRKIDDLPLAAHPESFQLESSGPLIFVNLPEVGLIAVWDRRKRAEIANWLPGDAHANFSMALDEVGHRLFVGCRQPGRVLVYDTETGKIATELKIAGDTDDLFWDSSQKCLYISCGEGFLDLYRLQSRDHYEALTKIPTAPGARTSFFSPELRRVFVAVPHREKQQAEVRVYAVGPSMP